MLQNKEGVWCDVVDEVKREGVFWTYNNPSGLRLGGEYEIGISCKEGKAKEYSVKLKQNHENILVHNS